MRTIPNTEIVRDTVGHDVLDATKSNPAASTGDGSASGSSTRAPAPQGSSESNRHKSTLHNPGSDIIGETQATLAFMSSAPVRSPTQKAGPDSDLARSAGLKDGTQPPTSAPTVPLAAAPHRSSGSGRLIAAGSDLVGSRIELSHDDSPFAVHSRKVRYTISRELGRGGMGKVYDAKDMDLGRHVAMKVIVESRASNNDQALRFVEEAQITGQLEPQHRPRPRHWAQCGWTPVFHDEARQGRDT